MSREYLLVFFVAYAVTFAIGLRYLTIHERASADSPARTRAICSALALIAALAAAIGPTTSDDVRVYVGYGRLIVPHGVNPYSTTIQEHAARDPVLASVGTWAGQVANYGPVALAVFALPNLLRSDSPTTLLLLLKGLFWLAFVVTILAAAALLGDLEHPLRDSVLVAFFGNPSVLHMLLVDAHVDLLLVLGLCVGALALSRKRDVAAGVAFGAACLVKFVGLLVVPLVALHLIRSRRRVLAFLGAFAAVTGPVEWWFAGAEVPNVLRFAGERVRFITSVVGVNLKAAAWAAGLDIVAWGPAIVTVCLVVFAVGYLLLAMRRILVPGEGVRPVLADWALALGLAAGSLAISQPWYHTLWGLPALALLRDGGWLVGGSVAYSVFLGLTVFAGFVPAVAALDAAVIVVLLAWWRRGR